MPATYVPATRTSAAVNDHGDDLLFRPSMQPSHQPNGSPQVAPLVESNSATRGSSKASSLKLPSIRLDALAGTAATAASATESEEIPFIWQGECPHICAIAAAVQMLSRAQLILEAAMQPVVGGEVEDSAVRLATNHTSPWLHRKGCTTQRIRQSRWESLGAKERHSLRVAAAEAVAKDDMSEPPRRSDRTVTAQPFSKERLNATSNIDLFDEVTAKQACRCSQAVRVAAERKQGDGVQREALSGSLALEKQIQEQLNLLGHLRAKFEADNATPCMDERQQLACPLNRIPTQPELNSSPDSMSLSISSAPVSDKFRETLLRGSDEGVAGLLQDSADPNEVFTDILVGTKKFTFATPLVMAVLQRKDKLLQSLVSARASPDSTYGFRAGAEQRMWNGTAIHAACPEGNVELVKRLVELRANVHLTGTNGATILWQAAYFGHENLADYAVAQGVDVELAAHHPDEFSSQPTPLHLASITGHSCVAAVLLQARADPNVNDGRGRSPLDDAVEFSYPDIVQQLIQRSADVYKVTCGKRRSSEASRFQSTPDREPTCLSKILESRNKVLISAAAQGLGASRENIERLDIADFIGFLHASGQGPLHILDAIFQRQSIRFWVSHEGKMQRRQLSAAHVDVFGGWNIVAGPHHGKLQEAFDRKVILGECVGKDFLHKLNPAPQSGRMFVPVQLYMCVIPFIHQSLQVQQAIADCADRRIFAHWGCSALVCLRWEAEKRGAQVRMMMAFLDLVSLSGLTFRNFHIIHGNSSVLHRHSDVAWNVTYIVSTSVWAVDAYLQFSLLIGYASNRLVQRYLLVPRHWFNVFNLVFAGSTLFAAGSSETVPSDQLFRLALGYLVFFKWMWFLDQIRLIEAVGLRVLPITTTMLSAGPFSGVLLIYLLGAANMYFALAIDTHDFLDCFIQMYHLTVLGEVDLDKLASNTDGELHLWTVEWLSVVMSFVIGVVLTNLFIAVLCHSYTVAAECARQDLVRHRAASVLEQFAIREGIMTTFCPRRARVVRHQRNSILRRAFSERVMSLSPSTWPSSPSIPFPSTPSSDMDIGNAYVWVATVSSNED